MIQLDGRVLVKELAEKLQTSPITIRKDLEELHAEGLLHRTHGGALLRRTGVWFDPARGEKEKRHSHSKEKLRIANAAAQMVQPGQSVVLDAGPTATEIARALHTVRDLTIITNAVNIAAELAGSSADVILTGGTQRKNSFSLVGPLAEESLRKLSADIFFLAAEGFDPEFGVTTPDLLEAKVNRVMMEIARETIVVCESAKFGERSLSLIAPTSAIRRVITDSQVSKTDLQALREAGITVKQV
jgi:DeoR family transcriptional regulator of aga operon